MSGIKMEDRTLKGLRKNPEEIEEMQFLNALTGLIPKSARIKELFSDEFIQWAKNTLAKDRRKEPNPGMDGNLDIMALWSMVNKERNDALKENATLKHNCDVIRTAYTKAKTRNEKLLEELDAARKSSAAKCLEFTLAARSSHQFPGVTIHSGAPEHTDIDYDLQHTDHITLDLQRTPAGTSFVIGATGLLPTTSPPPMQPPPKSENKRATFTG